MACVFINACVSLCIDSSSFIQNTHYDCPSITKLILTSMVKYATQNTLLLLVTNESMFEPNWSFSRRCVKHRDSSVNEF